MAIAAPFPAAGRTTRRTVRPVRSQARPADTLRLTTRGRVVLTLACMVLLLAIAMLSGRFSADAGTVDGAAGQAQATGVVVVQQGENLWEIAKAVAPGADPRETVLTIRELNGLPDSSVVPGQSLVVPVTAASATR